VTDARRRIPAVDTLLGTPAFAPLLERSPRERVTAALRLVQAALRERLARGDGTADGIDEPDWYAAHTEARLSRMEEPSLRPVINATGVVLHTNLGRALLAESARAAMQAAAKSYTNLEYDLDAGSRGSRYDHCTELLRELTGAQAALVVNNNAAAVVLALNTLAQGRTAVISRGELVEIGGSFRVSEIMARSGAVMREVGATNRTHLADYEAVAGSDTGVIVKVHRSNFQVTGFTAEVGAAELRQLGERVGVPVLYDLGSGLLVDLSPLGLTGEPTVAEALRAGADVVTLSGDKLLGGPQAGIILGSDDLVARMRRNPLCRAFRVDKLTLAALEATLALYRDPGTVLDTVPTLRMLALPADVVRQRAERLVTRLTESGVAAEIVPGASTVGGGAFPGAELATYLVAVDGPAEQVHAALRQGEPPVVARIADGRLLLDLRTVLSEDDDRLAEALRLAVH
jgi:L-seryl-tRNA(Ser) seleniumtransferase